MISKLLCFIASLNAPLQDELLHMQEQDQAVRKTFPIGEDAEKLDAKHNIRLKEILRVHGWPGKSLVGEEGAHAMWLLVQHQNRDLRFQKKCLHLLEKAVDLGEATSAELAYLLDRVRMLEGKPQVYGTQWTYEHGELKLYPVEEMEGLDELRKAIGLPSMADEEELIRSIYRLKKGF